MYPGQGSNGMQPIMSSNSQPIVSGGEAVILVLVNRLIHGGCLELKVSYR